MFQITMQVAGQKWFGWRAMRAGRQAHRRGGRSKSTVDFMAPAGARASAQTDESIGGWLGSSLDLIEGLHVTELFDNVAGAAAFG